MRLLGRTQRWLPPKWGGPPWNAPPGRWGPLPPGRWMKPEELPAELLEEPVPELSPGGPRLPLERRYQDFDVFPSVPPPTRYRTRI